MAVTFVIAAKNEEHNIQRCLESLQAVTTPSDEVIVVDDGSDDDTYRVASSVSGLNLRIIRTGSSVGRAAARNIAVQESRHEFIGIQDADDWALPKRRAPLAVLQNNPAIVAASGQCLALTPSGRWWRHTQYPTDPKNIADGLAVGVMTVCHTGSLFRKSAFREVGGYDASFPRGQDLDLFRRLAHVGPIQNVEDFVVVYRHAVILPWRYWSMTRHSRRSMVGLDQSVARALASYPLAQARRVRIFAQTTKQASELASLELAP